jgi:putative ABC transport system permease protein
MKLPLWRRHQDEELDEELRSHLRMAIEDRMARGESRQDAERNAAREFGNVLVITETTRDMWGWVWIDEWRQDVAYAMRALRKSPSFTLVAVLTLMMGVGANTAMFSIVQAVLLRPLPFPAPDRLVAMREVGFRSGTPTPSSVSYPNFADWRARNTTLQSISSHRMGGFTVSGLGPSQQMSGAVVSAEFFSTLGVAPTMGRGFRAAEEVPGNEVVVIADGFWRTQFGAAADVVGRTFAINGRVHTVIGVMPPAFRFPVTFPAPQFWVTFAEDGRREAEDDTPMTTQRSSRFLQVVGRLREGVTREAAQSEFDNIAAVLAREHPEDNAGRGVELVPQLETLVGTARPLLLFLLAAVGCVLLIACVNLANLLMARGAGRHRELALRLALGASRGRLARLLMAESLVLSAIGSACGVALAFWSVRFLVLVSPRTLRGLDEVAIDSVVLMFAVAIAVGCGLLVGVLPALRSTPPQVGADLRDMRTATIGRPQRRLLNALVVVETTLGVVLLVGATVVVRGFERLAATNPGFDVTQLVTMKVNLPNARYPYLRKVAFYEELLPELARTPGVEAVSLGAPLPLSRSGRFSLSFELPGRPAADASQKLETDFALVGPDYFRAMRIPLTRGRAFTASDNDASPRVIIINERFVREFFPDRDPVGERVKLSLSTTEAEEPWRDVVGISGDFKLQSLNEQSRPTIFVPFPQGLITTPHVVVRTASDGAAVAATVRAAVARRESEAAVDSVRTMEEHVATAIGGPRFATFLLTLFAAIGLALSAIGLYGVLAYGVTQRTQEFGVRFALGATRRDVIRTVTEGALRLVGAGLLLGIAASVALATAVTSAIDFVDAPDVVSYLVVAGILLVVGAVAGYAPARRAACVDPVTTLRSA